MSACFYLSTLVVSTIAVGAQVMSDLTIWRDLYTSVEYPDVFTLKWFYQMLAGLWMVYVMTLLLGSGPTGLAAWSTYTVQSWTLLTVRHFLAAFAPVSSFALNACEWVRFPAACSMTITFTVWNFVLFPFSYFVGMKTPEKRSNFLKFATSFRLTQIHVFNLVFGIGNLYWASPPRTLIDQDFFLAWTSTMLFMLWYLLVLDRIGVHLYPVFSPRAGPILVPVVWTTLFGMYALTFWLWRHVMTPIEV